MKKNIYCHTLWTLNFRRIDRKGTFADQGGTVMFLWHDGKRTIMEQNGDYTFACKTLSVSVSGTLSCDKRYSPTMAVFSISTRIDRVRGFCGLINFNSNKRQACLKHRPIIQTARRGRWMLIGTTKRFFPYIVDVFFGAKYMVQTVFGFLNGIFEPQSTSLIPGFITVCYTDVRTAVSIIN